VPARFWIASAWISLLSVWVGPAQTEDLPFSRVRSDTRPLLDLLHEGYRRSATFRALVARLEQSNVIVYVEPGFCALGHIGGCLLGYLNVTPRGERYLRVAVNPGRHHDQLLALIAHELQHACEVAEATDVTTVDRMLALFGRIGRSRLCPAGALACYETAEATRAGRIVLEELRSAR
jgi:hypothetical protein